MNDNSIGIQTSSSCISWPSREGSVELSREGSVELSEDVDAQSSHRLEPRAISCPAAELLQLDSPRRRSSAASFSSRASRSCNSCVDGPSTQTPNVRSTSSPQPDSMATITKPMTTPRLVPTKRRGCRFDGRDAAMDGGSPPFPHKNQIYLSGVDVRLCS